MSHINEPIILNHAQNVCNKIAPLWSLENYVAVNPYLGFSNFSFEQAAGKFKKVNAQITLPISFYLEELKAGKIQVADVEKALQNKELNHSISAAQLIENAKKLSVDAELNEINLVMDVAEQLSDQKWSVFITDRITNWASSYFDKGQALWNTTKNNVGLYESWKQDALIDKTPLIAGLNNFHETLRLLPKNYQESIVYCIEKLQVPSNGLELYFHALLLKVGGWAAYCSGIDWDNNLYTGSNDHTKNLLAILLAWELALLNSDIDKNLTTYWDAICKDLPNKQESIILDEVLQTQLCFQNAHDIAIQGELIQKLNEKNQSVFNKKSPIKAQAVFCIDVRSEVYRRNLEAITPSIATKGFAGFFGVSVDFSPCAQEQTEKQCPVLIPAGIKVSESFKNINHLEQVSTSKKSQQQYFKAWKSFKSGAVTGFSFVTSLGLTYIPKMFSDTFGITRPVKHPLQHGLTPKLEAEKSVQLNLSLEEQVNTAKVALSAMSLTRDFAKLVLFVGHGSSTVNNPHSTGLDCGACGGKTGEVNAKVAAKILNNLDVRNALVDHGISIPSETWFLACLHNTTTDEISIYNQSEIPNSHSAEVEELKNYFAKAGENTRLERSLRFSESNVNEGSKEVLFRSKDWSQVRPEWGLAGCDTFIVGPRHRTKGINLAGKSFLHDYNWKDDTTGGIITAIMSAPMVVTSWINLQYYASVVNQEQFGAGNKTLHNVVGGFGVIEGHGGDLKTGLPFQSVHDGTHLQHLPSRLNVIIEAPLEFMNKVIQSNEMVKNLCDNGWIKLLAMNENGKVSHRYLGNLNWENLALSIRTEKQNNIPIPIQN